MPSVDPKMLRPALLGSEPSRLVDISSDGRYVVVRKPQALVITDTRDMHDSRSEHSLDTAGLMDFAMVGDTLWAVYDGELRRFALASGAQLAGVTRVDFEAGQLWPSHSPEDAPCALWLGARRLILRPDGRIFHKHELHRQLHADAFVRLAGARGLLIAQDRTLRMSGFTQGDRITWTLPAHSRILALESLAGDRAFVALLDVEDTSLLLLLREDGTIQHEISLARIDLWTIAVQSGIALVRTSTNKELVAVDLYLGKPLSRVQQPLELAGMSLDRQAKFLAMAGIDLQASAAEGNHDEASTPALLTVHLPFHDLFDVGSRSVVHRQGLPYGAVHAGESGLPALAGLGRPYGLHSVPIPPKPAPEPYETPDGHLEDLLHLAALRTARAIALLWHQGRLLVPADAPAELPLQWDRMLRRYAGMSLLRDREAVASFDKRVFERFVVHLGFRTLVSLAQGLTLPFADLCYNLDLSYQAAQLLLMTAAPELRDDIARLYGILAGDDLRPLCDVAILEQILDSGSGPPEAFTSAVTSLVELGLARTYTAMRDGQSSRPLVLEPVTLAYIRGQRFAGTGPDAPTSIHWAERGMFELAVPDAIKHGVVELLAHPRSDGRPHRVILRGPAGSGRRSLATILVSQVNKPLALIHCQRLVRPGKPVAEALRRELLDAVVRSTIPMVSGLEALPEPLEPVLAVLHNHIGPLFIRADETFAAAIDPDAASFTLPAAAIPPSSAPVQPMEPEAQPKMQPAMQPEMRPTMQPDRRPAPTSAAASAAQAAPGRAMRGRGESARTDRMPDAGDRPRAAWPPRVSCQVRPGWRRRRPRS